MKKVKKEKDQDEITSISSSSSNKSNQRKKKQDRKKKKVVKKAPVQAKKQSVKVVPIEVVVRKVVEQVSTSTQPQKEEKQSVETPVNSVRFETDTTTPQEVNQVAPSLDMPKPVPQSIEKLPFDRKLLNELLPTILEFLSPKTVITKARVCKDWLHIVNHMSMVQPSRLRRVILNNFGLFHSENMLGMEPDNLEFTAQVIQHYAHVMRADKDVDTKVVQFVDKVSPSFKSQEWFFVRLIEKGLTVRVLNVMNKETCKMGRVLELMLQNGMYTSMYEVFDKRARELKEECFDFLYKHLPLCFLQYPTFGKARISTDGLDKLTAKQRARCEKNIPTIVLDPKRMKRLIEMSPVAFRYAPFTTRDNFDTAIPVVLKYPAMFQYCTGRLRSSKKFCSQILAHHGMLLQQCSKGIRSNIEMCDIAVENCPGAVEFVDESIESVLNL